MFPLAETPVARRPELQLSRLGTAGEYVVKDPRTRSYFRLGEEEYFLLNELDGRRNGQAVCDDFAARFGQSLSAEELGEFLELAAARGFLQLAGVQSMPACPPRTKQSLLAWRMSLFDPDRLFNWLAPHLCFFWTRAFFLPATTSIAAAIVVSWANRHEFVSSFAEAWCWETAVVVWLAILITTTCHEFAHGLTCKRHGGEVHEVGFLLLFLLPGFYCNVSDAWLIPERSKRLWVTAAGPFWDLFTWSLAVFVWRVTIPDSLVNYLAFIVLSVVGGRIFFNLNPLLKLDGYYLLSDWLELPNLRSRALGRVAAYLRWGLWGAAHPASEARGKLLFGFGVASWLFSMGILALLFGGFAHYLGSFWGMAGVVIAGVLGASVSRGLFYGLLEGEVSTMLRIRPLRTIAWGLGLAGIVAGMFLIEWEDRAGGTFQVRPVARAELRAPTAAFLKEILFDEGDQVTSETLIARLEVGDLSSRLTQKQAEVVEAGARLHLLEGGPRPEEVAEQRARVERARVRWKQSERDLVRSEEAFSQDLARLEKKIVQNEVELTFAKDNLQRIEDLFRKGTLTVADRSEAERKFKVTEAEAAQSSADRRSREARGTSEAEAELAKWKAELAEAEASLRLLEAGARPEEIDAERARLARVNEEASYLENLQRKLTVLTPISGVVTTPRLRERIGQYLREGDVICEVKDASALEVEIALPEEAVTRVHLHQTVELMPRGLPLETITARVDRIAPSTLSASPPVSAAGTAAVIAPMTALPGHTRGTVVVYCRLEGAPAELVPGMTGYAHIDTGRRPLWRLCTDRMLRYLRTEFWW